MKQCVQGHPASEERSRNLNQPPRTLCPLPPSAGPGWPGQPTCRTLPSDHLAEPPPPQGMGSPDREHERLPWSYDACARPEHRRPYTLWSHAGGTGWEGEMGAATKKRPHSLTLRATGGKGEGMGSPSWRLLVPRRNGLNGPMPETMTGTSSRLCPDQGDLPRGWACVFIRLWQSWTKGYTWGLRGSHSLAQGPTVGLVHAQFHPRICRHQGTGRGWFIRKLPTIVCGPQQYVTYLPATTDVFITLTCSAR